MEENKTDYRIIVKEDGVIKSYPAKVIKCTPDIIKPIDIKIK